MGVIVHIPSGANNVFPLFPSLNISDVEEFYIQVLDDSNNPIATTTKNRLTRCPECVRIHFINSLGCVDGITLEIASIKHTVKSESYASPVPYPLNKSLHKKNRFNVTAVDTVTAKTIFYGERESEWIDELFDSPMAWVESGTELIPIIILDSDRDKIKEDNPFEYELSIEYTFSHEKFIIRN